MTEGVGKDRKGLWYEDESGKAVCSDPVVLEQTVDKHCVPSREDEDDIVAVELRGDTKVKEEEEEDKGLPELEHAAGRGKKPTEIDPLSVVVFLYFLKIFFSLLVKGKGGASPVLKRYCIALAEKQVDGASKEVVY